MKNLFSSVDNKEIAKFASIADEWLNPEGQFKILHQINPLRIEFILSSLRDNTKVSSNEKIKVLDLGCGGGILSTALSKMSIFDITAVDACKESLEVARNYANKHNLPINYLCSTAEDLVNLGNQYDLVVCLEVLEHVANLKEFCANLVRLMKPNGKLIISTINKTVQSYLLAIAIAENVMRWIPHGTHDYNKFITTSELSAMLERDGLEIENIQGLSFCPLLQKWKFSNSCDVNYFMCAVKK